MTVKELKKKLNEYPDSMDVYLDERVTEFQFGLLNGIRTQEVVFSEDGLMPEDEEATLDTVLILTED